jgi:ATP/maltotriose-dependent transcriptional regulator MalT
MLVDEGEPERAEALLEESARRATEEGDLRTRSMLAFERGRLLLLQDDLVAAVADLEWNLDVLREVGDTQAAAWTQLCLALAQAMRGRRLESRSLLLGSLDVFVELGFRYGIAACLQVAARLALDDDDASRAARLLIRADALDEALGVARRGVDEELLSRQPWAQVRDKLDDPGLSLIRAGIPLGDFDDAVAYVSRYLESL